MKDAELVLRFFAFTDTYEEDYKPPMKRFLNGAMESPDGGIKKLNDNQIEEFKNIFEKCIRLVKEVFDKNAFRTFDVGSDKEVNGKWNKQLNTALFDVEMCGFAPYVKGSKWGNENVIVQCKDAIYSTSETTEFRTQFPATPPSSHNHPRTSTETTPNPLK
jgi:hypothetical protein